MRRKCCSRNPPEWMLKMFVSLNTHKEEGALKADMCTFKAVGRVYETARV